MLRGRLALLSMLVAAACDQSVRTTTTPLDRHDSPWPEVCRSAQDVDVVLSRPPQRPNEEVALVFVLGTMESDDNYEELRDEAASVGANYVVMDAILGDEIVGRAYRCPNEYGAPEPGPRRPEIAPSKVTVTRAEPPASCSVLDSVDGDPDDNYEELREDAAELGANVLVLDGVATQAMGFGQISSEVIGRAFYCPEEAMTGPTAGTPQQDLDSGSPGQLVDAPVVDVAPTEAR